MDDKAPELFSVRRSLTLFWSLKVAWVYCRTRLPKGVAPAQLEATGSADPEHVCRWAQM